MSSSFLRLFFIFTILCSSILANYDCPPNKPRLMCSEPAIFLLDVSSTMGNKENIATLFDWFTGVLLPQYGFLHSQTIQVMTYGSNSTPLYETWEYDKQVCPGMARLRQEAMDNGLQDMSFHDAVKQMKKQLGDEYGGPVIAFTAANNQSDIDAATSYKQKHLSDEYFNIVALNATARQWLYFYPISLYAVPIAQIYDYGNLDFCVLYASCKDNLENFCDITPPTTTKPVTSSTPTPGVTTAVPTTTQMGCQCKGGNCASSGDCYCPKGSLSYKNDTNGFPLEGCYYSPPTTINYALSKKQCAKNGGIIVTDNSADKQNFLVWNNLFDFSSVYYNWLGLVYDREQNKYFWQDNSTIGSFEPWMTTVTLPPPTGMDCVVINPGNYWMPADCRNSAGLVCQLPPCDQRGFCDNLA